MIARYGDILRMITGILALVLLVIVFVTSTIQGNPPDDELMKVLIPLVVAYFGSDVLSAKNAINTNKDE